VEYFLYNFQGFMLVFARLVGMFSLLPIYSSESFPFSTRMILSFLISMVIFPVSGAHLPPIPGNMILYGVYVVGEALVGITMGFIIQILFASFQMAGEFFNVQLGFGYTEVLDPLTQVSLPVINTLKNMMGLLIFLISGTHRVVIEALAYSFQNIKIFLLNSQVSNGLITVFRDAIGAMFLVSFKIALPVVAILFLVTLAEALMGKAAPQMNVMQLSFPVKVAIGLFVLISTLGFIVEMMVHTLDLGLDKVFFMIKSWPKEFSP
jgi:flagellar biosynthetic protein FliR